MAFAPTNTLFDEITDFFTSNPTLEQIIAFKPSEALDRRLHELLEKNSNEGLNYEERSELDTFLTINHMLIILNAKARLKLVEQK
jgi:hypothetical protein